MKPGDIPPDGHPDRQAFEEAETEKCLIGVNINGVPLVGSLYYHLCHHLLMVDTDDERRPRLAMRPNLRDNDWIIHTEYDLARLAKEIFCVGGARQIGKTDNMVSMCCRQLKLIRNSEIVGLFSIKADKETFTKKLNVGMNYSLTPDSDGRVFEDIFYMPSIDKTWAKTEVKFGLKQKDNTEQIWSRIFLYLTEEGNNDQVGAGKSTTWYFFDEIAKAPFISAHDAIIPALKGKYGLRSAPFMAFTGGNVEKSQDAKSFYLNPEANNIRTYTNDGKKTGLFVGGWYRQDLKQITTLGEYLVKKGLLDYNPGGELGNFPMEETDFEKANRVLDEEFAKAEKSDDKKSSNNAQMFAPRTIDQMFLTSSANPFEEYKEGMTKHRDWLRENPQGRAVDLFYIGDEKAGDVGWKLSNKVPIANYPTQKSDKLDAAIIMYEEPRHKDAYYLHAGGLDPYNTASTSTSPSLGAFYLYRRRYEDISDPFQDTMVLSYVARPGGSTNIFFHTIRKILILYGGKMLHEVSNDMVLNFFDERQEAEKFLVETWSLQQTINPKSKAASSYGLAPTERNIAYWLGASVEYAGEVLRVDKITDASGNVTSENIIYGYTRWLDPVLIDEYLAIDPSNIKGNYDRAVGNGHALAYMKYLNKYFPMAILKPEPKPVTEQKRTPSNAWMGLDPQKSLGQAGSGKTSSSRKSPFGFRRR
ncbi:hypothetical protein [Spirosoma terrae]|uniref:Terminase n=1 Tax=Spirosoma terrae TaxID=1968276 RepID=A0A6L9L555_9BACT|nr:hypothetical protein [Spirosoma terrae]NDU95755.1 hypothetical protein [Spirosoma terrae]